MASVRACPGRTGHRHTMSFSLQRERAPCKWNWRCIQHLSGTIPADLGVGAVAPTCLRACRGPPSGMAPLSDPLSTVTAEVTTSPLLLRLPPTPPPLCRAAGLTTPPRLPIWGCRTWEDEYQQKKQSKTIVSVRGSPSSLRSLSVPLPIPNLRSFPSHSLRQLKYIIRPLRRGHVRVVHQHVLESARATKDGLH